MYILFDIGGSKMRIAGSEDCKTFAEPVILDTPEDGFYAGLELFKSTALKLAGGKKIQAVAGGIAGTFSRDKDRLVRSPNLPSWVGPIISKEFSDAVSGAPVFIENDAAIVGLGEALVGAGKGFPIVSYFTISTGVGGARIVDGHIDEHVFGFEPGSIIVDLDGTTLEESVSGTSLVRRFGKKPREIPQESPVWDELARTFATSLHNSIVQWSPDCVVIGGSMVVGDPYIDVNRIKYYLSEKSHVYPNLPEIKKATLGSIGGIHGALIFLNQKLKALNS